MAQAAGCLPTDLLRSRSLPELMVNARLFRAARDERRGRVRDSVTGKDAFEAYGILLGEIAGEP